MDKDFSELVEYLDGKFTKIDKNFVAIEQNFIGIEQRFVGIEEKLVALDEKKADKEDINNLLTAIDAYAKKADTYFQEMVMLAHKVDKMDRWIHQIAEKVGIKLED